MRSGAPRRKGSGTAARANGCRPRACVGAALPQVSCAAARMPNLMAAGSGPALALRAGDADVEAGGGGGQEGGLQAAALRGPGGVDQGQRRLVSAAPRCAVSCCAVRALLGCLGGRAVESWPRLPCRPRPLCSPLPPCPPLCLLRARAWLALAFAPVSVLRVRRSRRCESLAAARESNRGERAKRARERG